MYLEDHFRTRLTFRPLRFDLFFPRSTVLPSSLALHLAPTFATRTLHRISVPPAASPLVPLFDPQSPPTLALFMANKTTSRQAPAQAPVAPPPSSLPASQAPSLSANTKKKKKKAAKKAAAAAAGNGGSGLVGGHPGGAGDGDGYDSEGYPHEHYDDDDDLPPLDNTPGITFTNDFPYPPASGYGSGANAAAAAAAAMNGAMGAAFGGMLNGLDYPASGLSPSAHADLVNTATELYRRMEDPTFGETEEYWTSLPSHLRNFIRNALPIAPSGAFGNVPNNAMPRSNGADRSTSPLPQPNSNTMLAMAQQIVSAAHANAKGVMGQANGVMPPFDPTSLDFAFQPHPDYDLRSQMPGRRQPQVPLAGQGTYMPGQPVGGVIMLDERDREEYDRFVLVVPFSVFFVYKNQR